MYILSFYALSLMTISNDEDRMFAIALYEDNYKLMFRVAFRYANSSDTAEDIVQEALVSLISKLDLLKTLNETALRAYIYKTVTNSGLDAVRKQSREPAISLDDDEIQIEDNASFQPEAMLLAKCTVNDLVQALQMLNDADRTMMTMKYFMDYDDITIAHKLNIKPATLRSKLSRIRNRLYTNLGELMS